MNFDGILFFPVTPFDAHDRVDEDLLRQHLDSTLAHAPGGVFPACGTGEFHALSTDEMRQAYGLQLVSWMTEMLLGAKAAAGSIRPVPHAPA